MTETSETDIRRTALCQRSFVQWFILLFAVHAMIWIKAKWFPASSRLELSLVALVFHIILLVWTMRVLDATKVRELKKFLLVVGTFVPVLNWWVFAQVNDLALKTLRAAGLSPGYFGLRSAQIEEQLERRQLETPASAPQ